MLDPVVSDLLSALYDALLQLPGVRLLMGLATPAWRPLWALTWAVALVYATVRVLESINRARAYRSLRAPAPTAGPRPLPHAGDLPPVEPVGPAAVTAVAPAVPERPAPPARRGRQPLSQRAALGVAALGAVLLLVEAFDGDAAERVQVTGVPLERAASAGAMAHDDPLADAAAAPPFTFAARGWRTVGGACVATLEVTGGTEQAGALTMYVMGASGTVLGSATVRVPTLTTGAFHDFRFPGVDCDAVTDSQVQG